MDPKLILFEINEVPYRVLETYSRAHPRSALSRMLRKGVQFETFTEDRLALDPWISWPTLHRGVNDEMHGILHLGQVIDDADAKYPPIWRILKQQGLQVGVFGSLHSSNVPDDAAEYSFYVPDYFATTPFAHPRRLQPFQEMNLVMTRASARNVVRSVPRAALRFIASLPGLGIRSSTLLDTTRQLLREVFDSSLRIRRRTYQSLIMMDLFMKKLVATRPHFASFYTNHVAAAMHRYWAASYPGDYAQRLDDEWIAKYSGEIEFAMSRLDVMCGQLMDFVERSPEYVLVVASSMGQAAIPAEKTYEFLTITDLSRFMSAIGVPAGAWKESPAMVPCQSVVVDEKYWDCVRCGLEGMKIGEIAGKWDKRPVGPFSYDEAVPGSFQLFIQFDSYSGPRSGSILGRQVALEEMGLGFMQHEDGVNCTAQHVPEGSLVLYSVSGSDHAAGSRQRVSTSDVVPSILAYFDIPSPGYMRGRASIQLSG
jgi:hypothetical protein